jgi:hypothetical protein
MANSGFKSLVAFSFASKSFFESRAARAANAFFEK